MPTEPQKDLVTEARELTRTPMEAHQFARRSRELLRQLCDEVQRLRLKVDTLTGAHVRDVLKEDDNG